jgi:hypothetical protein
MKKQNKTKQKTSFLSERALLPLLFVYFLAAGSVYEDISVTGGLVMIVGGLIMCAYAYMKHKTIMKRSFEEINQPLGVFIWNTFIPLILRHWFAILVIMLVVGILSSIYISSASNKVVQLVPTSAAYDLCFSSTSCPPLWYPS